jgi:hypothetical protein
MPRSRRNNDPATQSARNAGEIPLGYTAANLKWLVADAAESRSPYSEHQIAEWAFRYWFNCEELGHCADPARCPQAAVEVAQEIDGQWEADIGNAFEANGYQPLDYSTLSLLKDLWSDWLARLGAAGI